MVGRCGVVRCKLEGEEGDGMVWCGIKAGKMRGRGNKKRREDEVGRK